MTEGLVTTGPVRQRRAPRPVRRGFLPRLLRDPGAVVSVLFLLAVIVLGICAPLLTSYDPVESRLADVLAPPFTAAHPLGADGTGRDILAGLLYGARTSILCGLIVVGVALAIGVPTGLAAGYYRGWIDGVTSWIAGALLSLPAIIVLLVVLARVGRSTFLALAVFGVLIAPAVYQLVRTSVRGVREELYVDAAKVSGLRDSRILRRHILPVVVKPTIVQAALLASAGIGIEAGIAFLGLGSSDRASWGLMLNDASQNVYNAPILLLWPSAALVLTVMAFSILGNGLRDALSDVGTVRAKRSRSAAALVPPTAAIRTYAPVTVPTAIGASDSLLELSELRVAYPRAEGGESEVVRGVSLTLKRGEILGLVGESGSGKSQTAFSILGLLPRQARMTADRMTFDGLDLLSMSPQARNSIRGKRIGYIPQEPMSNLDPSFRLGFQLTEPMRHHLGLSSSAARTSALELLDRVGIRDPERVFHSYPHEISGGMAQRVLIAGAVSCNPDLLIADEPTTALDVTVQADVLDLLRSLQAERGMAVLLVTHNFGVVADLCDKVAVMQAGEIIEAATADTLFSAPRHDYTKTLLAAMLEDAPLRTPIGATTRATGTDGTPA
ncbi:dipeptide/oligopeptide/nickel ABC transporter permease/ATP-binding protein [Rathayibacter sp. VKM Ac-2857]|uniref:dipeptide/oligopeptide/nickel ABC transporter permease/ATP-binding protein n=1 Tax=Rathayibacter sp. VKM Ac-2857 TaxID=2739020 RepID=UPI0015661487|nr:dipeptide/oligopeptide/nickel ABC transporter permease/ATP-binding protein [Rathayibacter sp. VKM Ac-2857]NQX18063.1 dipeptide/oligopeptide/nickel ABC transporter permease/ATP-binding protein [Rathayibacter sp. VKM Ac-2857]